jgi:hypothetical protein
MLTILHRLLALPFYVRNAGTFGVVFYFAFGFMRPIDHEALIVAALGSPFLLLVLFVLWVLYTARAVGFIHGQLAAPDHLFLQTFRLVPAPTRWLYWFVLIATLLLPVIGYAGWMMARAVHFHAWGALLALTATVVVLTGSGMAGADYRLQHPSPDSVSLPGFTFRLPYVLFFPTYWLRYEPLSLLLTKLISGGLLVGICRLYPTDDYDQRLLLIGLMLAVITHSQVGRQLQAFEQRYLLLLPNLPFSNPQRFLRYGLIHGLVWLPELLILLRNGPESVSYGYITGLWFTGWCWLMFMHGLAYSRAIPAERWQTILFSSFIGGLVTIMFGLPLLAWGVIGWLGAVACWTRVAHGRRAD